MAEYSKMSLRELVDAVSTAAYHAGNIGGSDAVRNHQAVKIGVLAELSHRIVPNCFHAELTRAGENVWRCNAPNCTAEFEFK